MPIVDTKKHLTVNEFVEMLGDGTSGNAIRNHCSRGVIKAIKFGSAWMIPRTELRRFQKERRPVGRPVAQ